MVELKNEKKELIIDPQDKEFEICHASNICILPDKTIGAVWFAGSKEGADDVSIWFAKRDQSWSKPQKLDDGIHLPHWNPVLFKREDDTVMLFYKVGRDIETWQTYVRVSEDNGATWSDAKELVQGNEGGRGPVRCKALQLSNGAILAGASIEKGIWTGYADKSNDDGQTWTLSKPIRINVQYHGEQADNPGNIAISTQSLYGKGVIQPSLWESKPGEVSMLLRSTEGKIYRADSKDYGDSWSDAYATSLVNNNAGIDVVKDNDGNLILASNPVAENWGPRNPITLQVSEDNGATWQELFELDRHDDWEFSYPCVIVEGNKLYASYTYNRDSIAFWEFDIQ